MSSFFKDIREIVDPKSVHTEEQIVALVDEKFTSTNKPSAKCQHNRFERRQVMDMLFNVCLDCGYQWRC